LIENNTNESNELKYRGGVGDNDAKYAGPHASTRDVWRVSISQAITAGIRI
jgi:hypothetical protein